MVEVGGGDGGVGGVGGWWRLVEELEVTEVGGGGGGGQTRGLHANPVLFLHVLPTDQRIEICLIIVSEYCSAV